MRCVDPLVEDPKVLREQPPEQLGARTAAQTRGTTARSADGLLVDEVEQGVAEPREFLHIAKTQPRTGEVQ